MAGPLHPAWLGLAAAGLAAAQTAPAEAASRQADAPVASAIPVTMPSAKPPESANFRGETVSEDARRVADWIAASGDNRALPFVIIDKVNAKVFAFDKRAHLIGAAAALLGIGKGDASVPGIGKRRLAAIKPAERTTPAGRFVASLGHDLEHDILWIDYEAALSLHRVITGDPKDRRFQRLATETVLDNRISYGCINVPVKFYEEIISRTFKDTIGIVYILPETQSISDVFAIKSGASPGTGSASLARAF